VNMLDVHKAAKDSPTVKLHEFYSVYRFDGSRVFLFFEGPEDPSFYIGFVNQVIPQGCQTKYWCMGRPIMSKTAARDRWSGGPNT